MLQVIALALLLFVSCVLVFSSQHMPWNFPGDAPIFPMQIRMSLMIIVFSTCVQTIALLMSSGLDMPSFNKMLVCVGVSTFILISSCLGIAERHSPRWDAIRTAAIRGFQDSVGAELPTQLFGHGSVVVTASKSGYPYFWVEFGKGGNARFDIETMECVCSD